MTPKFRSIHLASSFFGTCRHTLLARSCQDCGRRLPRHTFERAPVKTIGRRLPRHAFERASVRTIGRRLPTHASERAPVKLLDVSSEARFRGRFGQDFGGLFRRAFLTRLGQGFRLRPLDTHLGERRAATGSFRGACWAASASSIQVRQGPELSQVWRVFKYFFL